MDSKIHLHFLVVSIVILIIPKNQTFQLINQGEYLNKLDEYGSTFRMRDMEKPYGNSTAYLIRSKIVTYTFGLYFYNTTRNAHVLGIVGGNMGGDLRWIWDANRNHPVRENATLTFGTNGNLVLADADGFVVWQTNTANKGFTGISMQTNTSFHHPTDTLAVGQSLKLKDNKKLVSRTSNRNIHDGPRETLFLSLGFIMYQNTFADKLVQYEGWEAKSLSNVIFYAITIIDPAQPPPGPPYYQYREVKGKTSYGIKKKNSSSIPSTKRVVLAITDNYHYQYYSFLRLESYGNLVAYIYIMPPAHPFDAHRRKTYTFFGDTVEECALRIDISSSYYFSFYNIL
ncbi:hypothetical protein MKX01_014716 [Papaver californicum]|nr:hypothetical protein MKX01_014716 [Papaver californicum]